MSVEAHEIVPIPQPAQEESIPEAAKRKLSSPWATGLVVLLTVLWTIPTFGLLVTSLRPAGPATSTGWWTAFTNPEFTLNNYSEVITGGDIIPSGITPYFFNTFAIAIPAAIFPLVIACMAAYAIAWVPFRGATFVFFTIFALQVVPLQMALLPLLQMFNFGWSLGPIPIFPDINAPNSTASIWAGTYIPLWIAHTMFALPLAIFLIHNFVAQLPRDLMEAAKVDGANPFLTFRKVVLPLSVPAIASFAIFQFLWVWNDLLVALTFAGGTPDVAPLTVYLANIKGTYGAQLHLITAGAFIAIIVPLIVFFSLQRFFVRGLLAGSVKG
ncbi:MAG: carbohydrate ABC transporter permease [Candidatus Nanopelagicales bacterium]